LKRLIQAANILLTVILIVVLVVGGAYAITAKRSADGNPTMAGYKLMTVLSGSMEPAIHVGDVIIARTASPADEIREGDVITYRTRENPNMLITHRVISITKTAGRTTYLTKGDNNPGADTAGVTPDQLVAMYRWRLPYFGYLVQFIRKPLGIVLFVILPGLYLIGMELRKMWQTLSAAEAAKARDASQGEGRSGT
jgi:signal peptidase I